MQKLDKKTFMNTELGLSMIECVTLWEQAVRQQEKNEWPSVEYRRAAEMEEWCEGRWEVLQMAVRQFYRVDYCMIKTDKYFGICTEDEKDWLYRRGR